MSAADVVHDESWTLIIHRAAGDDWPDRPVEYTSVVGKMYRPEKITAHLARGHRASVTVRGSVVKRDGTAGQVPQDERFWSHRTPPGWVVAEIRAVREAHGLTPDTTGVGWEL